MKTSWALLVAIAALFSTVHSDSDDVAKFNSLVDEVLVNLRGSSMAKKIDPLIVDKIEDMGMQAKDIHVQGISKSYRNGDCSFSFDGQVAVVNAHLAADDVDVKMKYKGNALYLFVKGEAEGYVKKVGVSVVIRIADGKAKLKSLKVTEMGDYTLTRLTGYTPLGNLFMKKFYNVFLKMVKPVVIKKFEEHMFPVLASIVESVQLPSGL